MINNSNPSTNITKQKDLIWQDTHSDLVAGIKAFSQNISLSDVMGDGEWRLIIADVSSKLKVFKGQILQNEAKLLFTPVAICSFYAPDTNNKNLMPYLAVAGGSYIFIYKNLKGTFKFLIPNVDTHPLEAIIWNDLKENKIESQSAIKQFEEIENKSELSIRTLELLSIREESNKIKFIEEKKTFSLIISNFVVCMTSLKKKESEETVSTSQLIVGTEGGFVYVIDHSGSKIISKFKLTEIPHQIITLGAYDVDYRIYIATRNGKIFTIKNGEVTTTVIDVATKIVQMVRTERSITLVTMDCYYQIFNPTGKKVYSNRLPSSVTCMELMDCKKSRYFRGVLVALKNLELRVYNEKQLLNIYKLSEVVFGMKFGRFGQEEESLVIISESGSLLVKSLIKNINIDSLTPNLNKKTGEELNLNVPKKTKLYLDLNEREKEFGGSMNSIFQNDLIRLRHKTLDTYVKMLKIGNAPQNYSTTSKVKLTSSLQGLGPNFKINLIIDNSGDEVITNSDLILEYDRNIFNFEKDTISLSMLMPNVPIKYSLKFKNISQNGNSGLIKILILDKLRTSPLITSTLKVPISELEIF